MTTYTFYSLISAVLTAGAWSNKGSQPTTKQGGPDGPDNWTTMENRGILIENGDSAEIGQDHRMQALFQKLNGILEVRDSTQVEIDKIEADILAAFKDNPIEITNIAHEVGEEVFSLLIDATILTAR